MNAAEFPLWSILPFLLLLLAVAVLPVIVPAWWHRNDHKLLVSIGCSIPTLAVLLPAASGKLGESLFDYFSFMVLMGTLFVICGGIHIRGEFAGTPLSNTVFLAAGAVVANIVGSIGASMLLVRPFLRANHRRQRRVHLVVFFIFLVCNIGGLLSPVGNAPLFFGFLRGVPFTWTLRLFPVWIVAVGIVLAVFNVYDQYIFARETPAEIAYEVKSRRHLRIEGGRNFLWMIGVMAAVILAPKGIREALMIGCALASWFSTKRSTHEANHFHFHPILEVGALFLGIFVTMTPVLEIMNARAQQIDLHQPWQYFWMAGLLSSFLDNAPTYLTFASMASGLVGGTAANLRVLVQSPMGESLLRAVSCGAVFMGANTYIGNGPNFIVKSIAEHHGVKMPSFAGYMLYSGAFLLPVFVILTVIFFR